MADVLDINNPVDLDVDDEGERKFIFGYGLGLGSFNVLCIIAEGIARLKDRVRKRKGRGFGGEQIEHEKIHGYDRVETDDGDEPGPQKCK